MAFFKFYALFCRDFLCFLCILHLVEINACKLLYGICHCDSFEGLTQIQIIAAVGNLCCAQHVLCYGTEHFFRNVHHALVICVGLIQLHQGEFGVMTNGNALVSEYTTDFIYSFKAADNQSLQGQLQCDTAVHINIQCIMVCDKGSCGCTAGDGLQNGSFYL